MGNIPLLVFFGVFAAIVVAYEFGRRGNLNSALRGASRSVPPVEVMLEYRNATGFTTLRKIRILGYVPRRAGRSCLFALCNGGTAPRTFRIDRIISVANLDGELLDLREFLTEALGVTA